MVTKLGPLCKVKLLNSREEPEKAGVGGSTPSLATIIPKHLLKSAPYLQSALSPQFQKAKMLTTVAD